MGHYHPIVDTIIHEGYYCIVASYHNTIVKFINNLEAYYSIVSTYFHTKIQNQTL